MLGTDAAFLWADLCALGLLTSVQVERLVASGRNARGRQTGTMTPVGSPIDVYIASSREALVTAAFGERISGSLVAVCAPGTDIRPDDQVVGLSGRREGMRYRVIDEPLGDGDVSPVVAVLERMREEG